MKSRGLKICNSKKLEKYLKKYNYQNIINGYNDPFLKNHARQSNTYDIDATDLGIIDVFEFDRRIALLLWENISDFERTLSSSISYCISEKMNKLGFKNGTIFALEDLHWNSIFNNKKSREEITNEICKFQKKTDLNLLKKYESINEMPIWSMVLLVSFGSLGFLYDSLSEDIKYNIIKSFKKIITSPNEFSKVIKIIIKLRNRIAHNNVIYNLSTGTIYRQQVISFLVKNDIKSKITNSSFKIYDITLILSKIQNKNLKKDFYLIYKENIRNNKNLNKKMKDYISKKP